MPPIISTRPPAMKSIEIDSGGPGMPRSKAPAAGRRRTSTLCALADDAGRPSGGILQRLAMRQPPPCTGPYVGPVSKYTHAEGSHHAEHLARPGAGHRHATTRATVVDLSRDAHLYARRGRQLGLHRARS